MVSKYVKNEQHCWKTSLRTCKTARYHLTPTSMRVCGQSCPTLDDPMDYSPPGSSPWNFPGKDTGAGCHFLLQGIFSTQ